MSTPYLDVFVQEAREHGATLERRLLDLEARPEDRQAVDELFRAAHTLKGMAATMDFPRLADVAHAMEDLLVAIRARTRVVDRATLDALLAGRDVLVAGIEEVAAGRPEPDAASALARLRAPAAAAPTAPGLAAGAGRVSTVRVPVDRLDTLVDTVGEVVVARSRLAEVGRAVADADLSDALGRLDRLTADLYENVLRARMMPLGVVLARFPRMVRDLAASLGKEIDLVAEGADVELDRSVVEQLADPLLHVLRNAADHGIETPAERERAGKPRRGTIRVVTRREQNRVVIDVSDDGRGIDLARVRAKAAEKGLVTREAAQAMSENDAYLLLTHPGFSTREDVSATSGRGVGMDVVRTWVESVGGSLVVRSEPGRGTTVSLRVPLTLAILQALVVSVGAERYVVPLDAVEATVDLRAAGVAEEGGREVFRHDGEKVPLVRLARALEVPGAGDGRYALVVERHGRRAGLAVDEVLAKGEVVVKPLARRLLAPGIGGATVLGDGRVALVLDVGGLFEGRAAGRAPFA